MELELNLDPDDASRLSRLPLLTPMKSGKARSRPVRILWHDSPDRALAQNGLALAEQRPQWRLERLVPDGSGWWPPGAPAPVLASGDTAGAVAGTLPEPLVTVAAFEGRAMHLDLATEGGPIDWTLLNGEVRAFNGERRISRVRLAGSHQAVHGLATALAGEVRVAVPRYCVAAEALAVATGVAPAARHHGAPVLPDGVSVPGAFAYVVGHLTDVILAQAPDAARNDTGIEPVHQMRVAVRRLRSAIKVFRPAVGCPAVEAADAGLKHLAERLAPTRDWDVFVTETAADIVAVFPTEQRLQRLMSAAERRRRSCHEQLRGFLGGTEFRRLGIDLACLAGQSNFVPVAHEDDDEGKPAGLQEYGAAVLTKRLRRLSKIDGELMELPPPQLHALRLRAKRLRYAAEIFAPLYAEKPTHRFLQRLTRLQDRLGALNDGAVAAGLLGELAGNHAFAVGLTVGFIGAHSGGARGRIERAWRRFHKVAPFWA